MQSEKEIETYGNKNILLVVYILTFLIGFPANMVAFYTFSKKVRQKAIPIDVLLLNLTISDIIFLLVLPFKMKEAADNMKWYLPDFLCPLTNFVFYTTIYNSTFFLTAISVERYLGVAFPIQYKLKRRPLYAMVASFFFWTISMAHVSIVYIMQYLHQSNTSQTELGRCYENFTQEQMVVLMPVRLELFLFLFCCPFLICCFCYINFVQILSQRPNISQKKRLRAIGLSLGTLLVFVVCFAPFNLSHVVGFIKWESPSWRVEAVLSSTINACLDPIIFYFSSSALSGTFHHFLKSFVERVQQLCGPCKALNSRSQDSPPNSNDSL
ncbi:free fatty acid receptor 2-like [Esox lucius]|uniref:free fatty acid receptor 2-like n=1 Tax=Esox lucius TaxID=8010 RepID=UPI0005773FB0|nr:free fatty acid receptor 2-like [Esox lucius]